MNKFSYTDLFKQDLDTITSLASLNGINVKNKSKNELLKEILFNLKENETNNEEIKVNFVFLRHGYGCHQAADTFGFSIEDDPGLSKLGVDTTIVNGRSYMKNLKERNLIQKFDAILSSPMIRCIETAYFIKYLWKDSPKDIFVAPYLREIRNGYTYNSTQLDRYYPLKSIEEQKEYLKTIKINDSIKYYFVEKFQQERKEPGDIIMFSLWFAKHFKPFLPNKKEYNILVITHSGVLNHFYKGNYFINSGILKTFYIKQEKIIENTDDKQIFINESFLKKGDMIYKENDRIFRNIDYICPSERCPNVCTVLSKNSKSLRIKISYDLI